MYTLFRYSGGIFIKCKFAKEKYSPFCLLAIYYTRIYHHIVLSKNAFLLSRIKL